MATSTFSNSFDRLVLPAKAEWEDPAVILERDLEVRAQDGPTGLGFDLGFLGPLNASGNGSCG